MATDPSIFIHWGEFQAGAVGTIAIVALVTVVAIYIGAKWRGIL